MAQKTENEETEFKVVPESIALCVKCGVAGNSAGGKLCQSCFNTTTPVSTSAAVPLASPGGGKERNLVFDDESFRSTSSECPPVKELYSAESIRDLKKEGCVEPSAPMKRDVNRCSGCRRKIGLTGFRCRCGEIFCATHRYSDRHDCSYDYKAAGREAIERENPLVKAAKIVRI